MANQCVPSVPARDIAFLGGVINYILENDREFREYVVPYTNAPVIINEGFKDTEDLDGLFSGWDLTTRSYDNGTWQYAGMEVQGSAGKREQGASVGHSASQGGAWRRVATRRAAARGPVAAAPPLRLPDPQAPLQPLHARRRCRRSAAAAPEDLIDVAESALRTTPGRERTSAFAYAVGWTQHTVGVQNIRAASIIQLLLGNIGRPGGGILALRGHASIQGSTDIPTLYDILPGYIPMPHAHAHETLDEFVRARLGAEWLVGQHGRPTSSACSRPAGATQRRRTTTSASTICRASPATTREYQAAMRMLDGEMKGYFIMGENPAVGSANSGLHRKALANARVAGRARHSARSKAPPSGTTRRRSRPASCAPRTSRQRCSLCLRPRTSRRTARSPTRSACCNGTTRRSSPKATAALSCGSCTTWAGSSAASSPGPPTPRIGPSFNCTGDIRRPASTRSRAPRRFCARSTAGTLTASLHSYTQLKDDGSTSAAAGSTAAATRTTINQPARSKPGSEQSWVAPGVGLGLARPTAASSTTALRRTRTGKPWSERKQLHLVGRIRPVNGWDTTCRTSRRTNGPITHRRKTRRPKTPLPATHPFSIQADGRGWLFVPSGLVDGPLPTHYEPHESPFSNLLYGQRANPARQQFHSGGEPLNPSDGEPAADDYPFVITTYRLTEHHTAGGMCRTVAYLSELQPELFCEVSPELPPSDGLRARRLGNHHHLAHRA